MAYASVILALVALVVLHELGHFLAARAVGIRATKFYVFFPPAALKRQVGDVEYGIGWIPAGGFVKLPGMFRPEPGDVAERLRWEYEDLLPTVDADARLRLDAARRDIAHAHDAEDLVAPLEDIREVLDAAIGTDAPEPAARKVQQRTRERIGGLLDDLHPKAYWRAALWRRMTVIFAGPFVNLVVAFIVLTLFFAAWQPRYEVTGTIGVASVDKGSPAAEAGIDEHSRIVEWNGAIRGLSADELYERIETGLGEPTRLVWLDEDGDRHAATVVPRKFDDDVEEPRMGLVRMPLDEDAVSVVGRTGDDLATSMQLSGRWMWSVTSDTFTRLPRVFFDSEVRESVGSVVGIVQVAGDVDRAGWLLGYVALISLILAVMNLLPLLPLDGGHLLFGILEAIRRRPMPRAAFERYSMVGLALVLVLFFIGLDNDIARARG